MPKPLDATRRDAIEQAVRDNHGRLSRNQLAKAHGVAASTVSKIATEAGLTSAFDRTQTKNATRAREADSASRRADLAAELLDDVAFVRAKIRQEWTKTVVVPGVGVERVEADSAEVAAGLQRLMTFVGIAVDKHAMLDRHDSDDSGGAAVDAWLRHVIGGVTQL